MDVLTGIKGGSIEIIRHGRPMVSLTCTSIGTRIYTLSTLRPLENKKRWNSPLRAFIQHGRRITLSSVSLSAFPNRIYPQRSHRDAKTRYQKTIKTWANAGVRVRMQAIYHTTAFSSGITTHMPPVTRVFDKHMEFQRQTYIVNVMRKSPCSL